MYTLTLTRSYLAQQTQRRLDRRRPMIRDECAAACGAEILASRQRDGNVSASPCRAVPSGSKSERGDGRECRERKTSLNQAGRLRLRF